MLRRTENISFSDEPPASAPIRPAEADTPPVGDPVGSLRAEIEREFSTASSPLRKKSAIEPQNEPEERIHISPAPSYIPKGSSGKQARRGSMDALRDEALRNVIAQVEDRNFGGLKDKLALGGSANRTRLLLLGVALLAGGGAAWLALQGAAPAPVEPAPVPVVAAPPPQVIAEPRVKVLAAKADVAPGAKLTPDMMEWVDWPESSVRPEYLTDARAPAALEDVSGRVVRTALFAGDPIRLEKLADGGESLLSALIAPGMRAVSIEVEGELAAGGFIRPNDRVDLVVTRAAEFGVTTFTALSNVRVVAINADTGRPAAAPGKPAPEVGPDAGKPADEPATFATAVVTFELTDKQSEIAMNASQAGRLVLVLRPAGDKPVSDGAEMERNRAIRLTSRFWK
jgi:pilus assembly protein CpaB